MKNLKTLLNTGFVLSCASLLIGCASIVSDSSYPVSIGSNPEGATATIRDSSGRTVFSGRTPTIVTLKAGDGFFSGSDYIVEFEKEGYAPVTTEIHRGIDGWYFGNILFGGLIGLLIVDPATGAMWRLPEHVHADLHMNAEAGDDTAQLQILMLKDLPSEFRNELVSLN